MIKVLVSNEAGVQGSISYSKQIKSFQVDFPDESVVKKITAYLSASQTFRIPVSKRMDDFVEVIAFPTDRDVYFRLALSCLWANTGIWVHWEVPILDLK